MPVASENSAVGSADCIIRRGAPLAMTVPATATRYSRPGCGSTAGSSIHEPASSRATAAASASRSMALTVWPASVKRAWVPTVSPMGSAMSGALHRSSSAAIVLPSYPITAGSAVSGTTTIGVTMTAPATDCRARASSTTATPTAAATSAAAPALRARIAAATYRRALTGCVCIEAGHSWAYVSGLGGTGAPGGVVAAMKPSATAAVSTAGVGAPMASRYHSSARAYIASISVASADAQRLGISSVHGNTSADAMPTVTLTAKSVGQKLCEWFQGWHESSTTEIGRTVFFAACPWSDSHREIHAVVQAANGRPKDDPEYRPFAADRAMMRPIYIRARGGTSVSAVTLCEVDGYVAPTDLYISSVAKVLEALNRHAVVFADTDTDAARNSFIRRYPKGTEAAIPGTYAGDRTWKEVYFSAVRLASDVIRSADPQWRDPRSRAETNLQFQNVIRRLARHAPVA